MHSSKITPLIIWNPSTLLSETPASPTSPASTCVPVPPKPTKKRSKPSAPSSPIQHEPKSKKRKDAPRPSKNTLSKEVAEPTPEPERQHIQAVPMSDCESVARTWELAVPISQNGERCLTPLEEEEKPDINAPGHWELAVPIDPPDSMELPPRSPPWEMAVPISGGPDPSAPHHSPSAGRTWDLAVPITHDPPRNPTWEQAVPISESSSSQSRHPKGWELAVPISRPEMNRINTTTQLSQRQRRPYERAVPIEQSPSPAPSSPSQRASHHLRITSGSSSRELIIDPALRDLNSIGRDRRSSAARTNAPPMPRSLSGVSTHQLDQSLVPVKEEESE